MSKPRGPEVCSSDNDTVLDAYFEESALGAEHRTRIAMARWNAVTPAERLELQLAATALGGGNTALSQDCAQDLLLLDTVNARYALVA